MAFWNKTKTIQKAQIIEGGDSVPLWQPIGSEMLIGYNPNFGTKKFNSENLLKLYNEVGAVNSVINFIATRCGELPINHVKKLSNGKIKILGDTDAIKAIRKLRLQNIASGMLIHGNVPVWKMQAPGFKIPSRLEQLPSQHIFPIPEKSIGFQGIPSPTADPRFNPISGYNFLIEGKYYPIPLDELIYIKNTNPNLSGVDYYSGMSPLYAAVRSIDILSGLYDTINTVTQYKGALGFIKKISRPGQVDPLAGATEGKTFTDEYFSKYGMNTRKGQKPIGFTPFDLAWVKVDAPIRDFLPVELTSQQFGHLCNQFAISDVLMNNNEASTESNVKAAEIRAYENCFKPLMKNILESLSEGLGLNESGECFEADYSEVACLQESTLSKYQGKQTASDHLITLCNAGFITRNQVLEELGYPTNPDPEWDKLKEQDNEQQNGGTGNGTAQTETGANQEENETNQNTAND